MQLMQQMRSKNKRKPPFCCSGHFHQYFPLSTWYFFPAVSETSGGQSFIPTGSSDLDEKAQHATLSGNHTYTSCDTLSLSIKISKNKKIPLRASGHPTQLASWCAVKSYVSLLLNGKWIAGDNITRQNIYNTVGPSLRQPERKKTLSALPAVVMRRRINMSLCRSEELTEIRVWEPFSSPLPVQPASALLWCAACLLTSKQQSSRPAPYGRKRVIASYTKRKWEEKASVHTHSTHTLLHRLSL